MKVKILRQQAPDTEPYWETFSYDGPQDNTVAGILDYLNYNDDITDINGNKTSRINAAKQAVTQFIRNIINTQ